MTVVVVFCGCGSTTLKSFQTSGLLSISENHVLCINELRGLTLDNGAEMKSKYKRAQLRNLKQKIAFDSILMWRTAMAFF